MFLFLFFIFLFKPAPCVQKFFFGWEAGPTVQQCESARKPNKKKHKKKAQKKKSSQMQEWILEAVRPLDKGVWSLLNSASANSLAGKLIPFLSDKPSAERLVDVLACELLESGVKGTDKQLLELKGYYTRAVARNPETNTSLYTVPLPSPLSALVAGPRTFFTVNVRSHSARLTGENPANLFTQLRHFAREYKSFNAEQRELQGDLNATTTSSEGEFGVGFGTPL
jgi:hypothetical protein